MRNTDPAVAVLPYGKKLGLRPARIALDDLNWPLGQPARLKGRHLSDLAPTDHLILYPRDTVHFRLGWGTQAKVSLMVVEPRVIHGHHMRKLALTHRRFHRVLSCDEAFLASIPNGVFQVYGTTWVPGWRDLPVTKSQNMSLIASAKRSQEGHRLRHALVDWAKAKGVDMTALGGGYAPFEEKSDGLAPYRFSVVIENIRERNYFSEKLVDAVLCETVPIYWGCPNLGDFLDTSGMIICQSEAELRAAIEAATPARYAALLPALRAIKAAAAAYGDIEARAARAVIKA
ncbi:hypothetical protein N6L24_08165 [Cognatishimia sp. SS12]|uniref:hypothetical protein n=1 Tax=Cognatishimia sp. SS12 TaxID=2979465 RepID=UPI00232E94F5|nr:hypothetical protein [Cognatishimia sp. SS12]MDC0738252.1 hypothetical protein [Cognatishimia sp. SS12]